MDWDCGHTAWFWSTASGHGLELRSHSLVLEYGLRAWIGITVTQPGWDYGHKDWFSSTASGHGLRLWSHRLVYQYGLRAWFGIMVTQPGLAVQHQGMVWNYGHTACFSSTASGHGLRLWSHRLV